MVTSPGWILSSNGGGYTITDTIMFFITFLVNHVLRIFDQVHQVKFEASWFKDSGVMMEHTNTLNRQTDITSLYWSIGTYGTMYRRYWFNWNVEIRNPGKD